jgi:heme exporter protein A
MLTLNNINFTKKQKKILCNFGFTIGLGSAMIIKGDNGSGKTSLLKIIGGIYDLESGNIGGEILWNNENIKNIEEEFYSDIQYLGHKNFLKQELTVIDNLKFFAALNDSKILVDSALNYFELIEISQKKVKELSAGWQKRVLLAKLLCCPKTLWLLDEPTINLDKTGKELLFNLIQSRIKDQGIVILTSHDNFFDKIAGTINLKDFKNDSQN